jgi:hypothetical protein
MHYFNCETSLNKSSTSTWKLNILLIESVQTGRQTLGFLYPKTQSEIRKFQLLVISNPTHTQDCFHQDHQRRKTFPNW